MKNASPDSRRKFLGKLTATAVSLGLIGGMDQEVFSGPSLSSRKVMRDPVTSGKKFVPVMLTPYTQDLKIDFNGLSALMDYYLASGAKGFFANCLSSEMYDLTGEERLSLARYVVKRADGKVPVVATGSFGNSIHDRIEFAKRMHDTGVNAVIIITSHFADKKEDDKILIGNFEKFFAGTRNIPVGTYECPSPYKRVLTPDVWRYLLSTDRLIYHKDTTLDLEKIKVKLSMAKNGLLEFYDAHTPNALSSLKMGAKGMSCIAGNFYPEVIAWICQHINDAGKDKELQWLQTELTRVDSIVSRAYSLSAKYFLHRRGVPLEINSRRNKITLTRGQQDVLDQVYKEVSFWHERLGIA